MKPYRLTINLTVAAETAEDAGSLLDQVADHGDALGLRFEGGHVTEMRAIEVHPGSALAGDLRRGAVA